MFSGFSIDFRTFLPFISMEFLSQVKNFPILLDSIPSQIKQFFYQWDYLYNHFPPELYFSNLVFHNFRVPFALQPFDKFIQKFHQNLEMSCDVFKTLLCKNIFHSLDILSSTPSFQIWSSGQFCTTTYLNISLKLLPKFWDVNRSILINFLQKPSDVLWKIWVNHPHLHSGPTWWIVLQLYFDLLLLLWFLFLLVALPAKTLSPRGWTHWSNSSSCNHALFFLSKSEDLQNLH